MMKLRQENGLRIFGGCCGTDYRHMEEVARLLTQEPVYRRLATL